MKLILPQFLIFIFTFIYTAQAQIASFPEVTYQEANMTKISLDSSASAVVLIEKGNTSIQSSEYDRAYMVFHTYKARIKILNKEGFDQANFTIPLYKYGSTFERIENINGTTYNLENNKITSSKLERKNIFNENKAEYLKLSKFTLPNIKEGSIIDVEYTVVSPDIFNFRTWDFQSDIPKLKSEYNVLIPGVYQYNVVLKGALKLTDTKTSVNNNCITMFNNSINCSNITYIMDSIPAFVEEPYMLAAKNYMSAIYFELKEAYVMGGQKKTFTKNWSDVDRELLLEKEFGGQIKKKDFIKEKIDPSILAISDPIVRAQKTYDWIQQSIKWNNTYGKYSQNGVEDALKNNNGNIADINLALIAALNAANIEAYPILVSTRNNGLPNNLHPVISDFNYVIVGAKINNEIIQLDASDRLLPFGQLPLRAINGEGRIIYNKKSSEWIPLTNNIISSTYYIFNGKLNLDGTIHGELLIQNSGLDAYNKRREILDFPSFEEYTEKLDERMTNIDFKKTEIDNLENTENILSINSEIVMNIDQVIKNGTFHVNPIFIDRTTKNPFNLDERTYAVDLGARRNEAYEINIEMPEGTTLTNGPKSMSIKLPDNTTKYTYKSKYENNTLSVTQLLQLGKAIYSTDEYFGLKELFSRIIQQSKVDYTFNYQAP